MRFRWRALALAPLVFPFMFSLALCVDTKNPVSAFFFFMALSTVFCYGVTIVLFVPALFFLSRLAPLQFYKICLPGIFLGIVIFLPVTWISYQSSGPDSGPPDSTFLAYLWRSLTDGFNLLFPLGGLMTAITYWQLTKESVKAQAVSELVG